MSKRINNDEIEINILIQELYDVYLNHNSKYRNKIQQANMLASLNPCQLKGHDATLKDVWIGVITKTQTNCKYMIELIRKLPGVGSIRDTDQFKSFINDNVFEYYLVKIILLIKIKISIYDSFFVSNKMFNSVFYMNFNDEIYYTRKWREKIVGKQTTDAIFEFSEKFNQLELFDSEKAILFPLIITNYGNNFNFIKYFFFFNY